MKLQNKVVLDGKVSSSVRKEEMIEGKHLWWFLLVADHISYNQQVFTNRFKIVCYSTRIIPHDMQLGDIVRVQGALQSYQSKKTGELMCHVAAQSIKYKKDIVNTNKEKTNDKTS